jgi:hypothetical protein
MRGPAAECGPRGWQHLERAAAWGDNMSAQQEAGAAQSLAPAHARVENCDRYAAPCRSASVIWRYGCELASTRAFARLTRIDWQAGMI